jgi:DNA-binding CsgD family transcriptional regulator
MNFSGESYNLGFTSRQVLHPKEGKFGRFSRAPVLFFIVLLVATALIVFMIISNPIPLDSIEYAERLIEARAQRASELANAIEAITYQFYANRMLNDLLLDYTASKETYDVSRWNSIFSYFMEGMAEASPELEDAMFFDSSNIHKRPLTMTDSLTRLVWNSAKTQAAEIAEKAGGKPIWTFLQIPYPSSTDISEISNYLICARTIKNVSSGEQLGLLILLVNPERIATTVAGGYWNSDSGIPKTDLSVLVSEEGKILGCIAPRLIGCSAEEIVPGYISPWPNTDRESGRYVINQSILSRPSRNYLVIWRSVPEKPWQLFTVLPYSKHSFKTVVIMLSITLVVAGFFLMLFFLRVKSRNYISEQISSEPAEVVGDFAYTKQVLPPLSHNEAKIQKSLSAREQAVLAGLAKGLSNKEIASDLNLQEQTVKNYLSNLYRKLGIHDRVEAVFFAIRAGLNEKEPSDISHEDQ